MVRVLGGSGSGGNTEDCRLVNLFPSVFGQWPAKTIPFGLGVRQAPETDECSQRHGSAWIQAVGSPEAAFGLASGSRLSAATNVFIGKRTNVYLF